MTYALNGSIPQYLGARDFRSMGRNVTYALNGSIP